MGENLTLRKSRAYGKIYKICGKKLMPYVNDEGVKLSLSRCFGGPNWRRRGFAVLCTLSAISVFLPIFCSS